LASFSIEGILHSLFALLPTFFLRDSLPYSVANCFTIWADIKLAAKEDSILPVPEEWNGDSTSLSSVQVVFFVSGKLNLCSWPPYQIGAIEYLTRAIHTYPFAYIDNAPYNYEAQA